MTKMEPTPEQLILWTQDACLASASKGEACHYAARIAYAAGADAELEASEEWLPSDFTIDGQSLRDARRPKPPSRKEQALEALEMLDEYAVSQLKAYGCYAAALKNVELLRVVLESLPEDT